MVTSHRAGPDLVSYDLFPEGPSNCHRGQWGKPWLEKYLVSQDFSRMLVQAHVEPTSYNSQLSGYQQLCFLKNEAHKSLNRCPCGLQPRA